MATKPANKARWAETGGGAPAANILEPTSGQKDTGWTNGQVPPSNYLNWWMWQIYQWILYLDDLAAQAFTWTAAHVFNAAVTFAGAVAFQAGITGGISVTGASGGDAISATGGEGSGGIGVNSTGTNGKDGVKGTSTGVGVHGVNTATGVGVLGEGGVTGVEGSAPVGLRGTGTGGSGRGAALAGTVAPLTITDGQASGSQGNGDVWIDGTTHKLRYKANGTVYEVNGTVI